MNKEPALGIGGSLTAVLYAIVLILRGSGVLVSEDIANGLEALIYALCAIPLVSGALTRLFVTPTGKVEAVVDTAYAAMPGADPKPVLPA